jgi:predicted Fe-Mo cluster-binding NifX family protein
MSDEIVVLRVFDNEVEAQMAQQMLRDAGVATFIFKDDGGGMEPHLQRTNGVRLVLNSDDAVRAQDILQALESA